MAVLDNKIWAFNESQFPELDYVLQERHKPAVLVCAYDAVQTRKSMLLWITKRYPEYDHMALDLAGENIGSLYKFLNEELGPTLRRSIGNVLTRPDGKLLYVVHLIDLEFTLRAEPKSGLGHLGTHLVSGINFERELFFRELPCVLILWTNRYTYDRIRREAPDFWDWVTHIFHFRGQPEQE